MREITERDEQLFEFLFKFRYATIDQIAEYLQMTKRAAYKRVEFLQIEKYIESKALDGYIRKLYANGPKVRNEAEGGYQRKVKIAPYGLEHHLKIIDMFIKFLGKGIKEKNILSEREIRKEKIGKRIRRSVFDKSGFYKIPDLVIKAKESQLVAVEVELSKKNSTRLWEILRNYTMCFEYTSVVYLCEKTGVKTHIKKNIKKHGMGYKIIPVTFEEFEEMQLKDWLKA